MDLKKLFTKKHITLYQQNVDGCLLAVKETAQYRWFEYSGASVQSLMDKERPEQILLPVYQSLLLFLLLKRKPLKLLNLGLGGASIERALALVPDLCLTSVEASQAIIDMAKDYFYLPEEVCVVCQKAEHFIQQTKSVYDVVLCDLFIGKKNPDFLFKQSFYAQLAKITSDNALLMINLQADNNEQLLRTLLIIRKFFPYIALMEFSDYKNIVIMCSSHEIPAREILQEELNNFTQVAFTCLDKVIEEMHYIPASKD